MAEITISDYGVFDQGKTTTNSLKQSISNYQSNVKEASTSLSDSVFLGPICDESKKGIDNVSENLGTNITQLQTIGDYLSKIYSSYKKSDTETLNQLLGITSTTDTTEGKSSNSQIQSALNWAMGIAKDNSHGYSQNTRWGNPNYDCSSLVISAYEQAGVRVKSAGATSTRNMKSAFTKCGFEWIPGDPKKTGLKLQPGDVLLKIGSHTEMYVGNNKNVGAHSNFDGKNGDSKGNEINIKSSNHAWDGVLRLKT